MATSTVGRFIVSAGIPERQRAASRSNGFDLLRLVGAIVVLIEHSWYLLGYGFPLPEGSGTSFGRIGVGIFFLTSGYLITSSWLADSSLVRFARRRALRIYPLYFVVIVGLVFAAGPLLTELPLAAYFADGQTWAYLFRNLLIFPSEFRLPGVFVDAPASDAVNGAIWTIPNEILCYVGVALLGVVGVLRRRWLVSAVVVIALGIVLVVAVSGYRGTLVPYLLDARAAEQVGLFVVGMASRIWIPGRRLVWWIAPLALAGWVCTWGTPLAEFGAVVVIATTTLMLAFRMPTALQRPTGSLDLSYGIYLMSYPVQQALIHAGVSNAWLLLGLTMLVVVPMAALSWHYVERPALRLKPSRSGDKATDASHDGLHHRTPDTKSSAPGRGPSGS